MSFVSTSTEIALIDARSNSGAITLPRTSQIPGRIITIKDAYGTFFSSITLVTQGGDFFEDGTNSKTIGNPYGNLTVFAGSTTRWYVTNGTTQNAFTTNILTVSTIWAHNWPTLNSNYNTTQVPGPIGTISLMDNIFTSTVAATQSTFIEFGNLNPLPSGTTGSNAFRYLLGVERGATASDGLMFKLKRWNAFLPTARPYGANIATLQDSLVVDYLGRTGLNTSAPNYILDVNGNARISSLILGVPTVNPSTNNYLLALTRDLAFKPTTTVWNTVSDQRVKENIVTADLDICYENVKQLPLRRFTYNSTFLEEANVQDKYVLGFIAQEVSTILPKAVQSLEGYGFSDLMTLNIDQVTMSLYGAVKRTIADKEALQSTTVSMMTLNTQLSNRLSTLEGLFYTQNNSGNI
jgi:hypothetical protein